MSIRRITGTNPSQIAEPTTAPETGPPASSPGINAISDSVERASIDAFAEAFNPETTDPNSLVQNVIRESYVQTTEDLRFFAEKVRALNQMKSELTERLSQSPHLTDALKNKLENSPPSNIMEILQEVLKQSVQNNNEDKKYYLGLLNDLNRIARSISHRQETIDNASRNLASQEQEGENQSSSDDDRVRKA